MSLVSKQSKINGLLVVQLGSSNFAGKASPMNATAVPAANKSAPSTVQFNQDVGESMGTALKEVRKFLTLRHNAWPAGYEIEVAFEDKWGPKDGPSAAVACALMIDSLITGDGIKKGIAITGDMNADGTVQPVGGVADKVRGAAGRKCTVAAVPDQNKRSISDLMIAEGIDPLLDIQIFSVKTFDEAKMLVSEKRPASLEKAIQTFSEIQKALKGKRRRTAMISHPKVVARLKEVTKAAPNHLCARLLYLKAIGRAPTKLSLSGSLGAIDQAADKLLLAARTRDTNAVGRDEVAEALNDLRNLRLKIEKRTTKYADALTDFGQIATIYLADPPRSETERRKMVQRLNSAGGRVDAEILRIKNDKAIMEDLLR